jgi:hypothetical protein
MKFHTRPLSQWHALPCQLDHPAAGFDNLDLGVPVASEKSRQESAIAFA